MNVTTAICIFDIFVGVSTILWLFWDIFGDRACDFTWETVERIDGSFDWDNADLVFFGAMKIFFCLGVCYGIALIVNLPAPPTFRQLTQMTIDANPPAPLVPCSAYPIAFGDSIVMSDRARLTLIETKDLPGLTLRCDDDIASFEVTR